ncbi:MAG: DEAD/DEAH box helicase [Mycobacteriaceae bacterium]
MTRSVQVERELQAAQAEAGAAQQRADVARARLAEARDATRAWGDEHRRRVLVRSEHRRFRPRFLEWLTSLGAAMREWLRHDQHLAAEVARAEAALSAAYAEVARLAEEAAAVDGQLAACQKAQRRKQQEAEALRAVLAEAQTQLGAQFPDRQWWEDRDRRERATLWTDPEWNRVRTEVFLEALRLHKAFLEHEPTRMRQSLQAAADLVAGDAPRDLPAETALAAWRSLLFVVPVISTTFASFARLFSHLGRESLGWLFVDEAGQATPQSTVGALWRSRRAVVLGDPLQLEPITTLPFRAEQAIRNSHGVDELWLSSRTSVQRLADRSSRLGTWLPGDEGKIWVGAPLTLHRRCDEPMFGIANRIAYGGLMIYGTGWDQANRFLERYPPHRLPMSKWVDVRSDTSEGHWKPAEGEQLDRILRVLARLDFDFSQVMVIAPFRDVARQVKDRARSYKGLVAGTIHTAQGKQADIVILVLGGDPARPGAKSWAAGKPNLLNVAVSRAKRRLYVIGDRRSWAQHRYFDVLARELTWSAAAS